MPPTDHDIRTHDTPSPQTSPVDWLVRAQAVAPIVATAGDQIDKDHKVPIEVMSALHEAELFRLCLPSRYRGGEADALSIFETVEAIARADASTAWCLGQAYGCSMAAAYLEPDAVEAVFGDPAAVVAWGPPDPNAQAIQVDGGYRLTGYWHYGSGIRNATWVGAHCRISNTGDGLKMDADGRSPNRTFLFPIDRVILTDVWDVVGLRGTGSFDYAVTEIFVPDEFTFIQNAPEGRRENGPLYQIPVFPFYGIPFAAVALGVAQAALDDFLELAAGKIAYRTTVPMRESTVVQVDVAKSEAKIAASRAYLLNVVDEIWTIAVQGGEYPLASRARLRLAVTYAMNQAREVVEAVYRGAGGTAIFENKSFARRFRDMYAISQQAQANERNYEAVGQALLGLEPEGGRI